METRTRLLAQIKAHRKLGSAELFEVMDTELQDLLTRQIAELETRIEQVIASDETLTTTADILRSDPGGRPGRQHNADRRNAGTGPNLRRTIRRAGRPCAHCT